MQKVYYILFLALSALSFAACGQLVSEYQDNSAAVVVTNNQSRSAFDISMDIVSVSSTVEQGKRLIVEGTVKNLTSALVDSSFLISFYASRDLDEYDPVRATWLHTVEVNAMGKNNQTDFTARITIPGNESQFAPGEWRLFAFADSADQVIEVEEEDNIQGPWMFEVVESTTWPDLAVTEITDTEGAHVVFRSGQSDVGVELTITNYGDAPLYKEYYLIRFELMQTIGDFDSWLIGYANNWEIPAEFVLAPGESFKLTAYPDIPVLDNGWYLLRTTIDSSDTITESDESNNGPQITVVRVKNY